MLKTSFLAAALLAGAHAWGGAGDDDGPTMFQVSGLSGPVAAAGVTGFQYDDCTGFSADNPLNCDTEVSPHACTDDGQVVYLLGCDEGVCLDSDNDGWYSADELSAANCDMDVVYSYGFYADMCNIDDDDDGGAWSYYCMGDTAANNRAVQTQTRARSARASTAGRAVADRAAAEFDALRKAAAVKRVTKKRRLGGFR